MWSITRTGRGMSFTTRISGSSRRAARPACSSSPAPGGAPPAAAVDLEGAPQQPHGSHARLLDRLDEAVRERLLVVEELRERPHLAGRHAARASPATASSTFSRAKPASTAAACAARRSARRASAGSACGFSACGSLSPSSSQTCAPLVGVEAGERHEAVRARVRAVVGVERLEPSLDAAAPPRRGPRPARVDRAASTATKRCAWSASAAPSSDTSTSAARSRPDRAARRPPPAPRAARR